MISQVLPYQNSLVHYLLLGGGEKTVLCFHGYGESAESFSFLETHAGKEFCFVAIDLPFHGKTDWKEGANFSITDLQNIVNAILQNEKRETTNDKLTLLGFSLGGRISLALYEKKSSEIEKLVLLAPDGLKINFWYWLSTQTWLGNRLFKFTMQHPSWFFGFLKILNVLGLVNKSIFKFVNYYIGDAKVREELYNRWTTLRKIRPQLRNIKNLIQKNKTLARLVYGRHDRIILSSRGEKFCKGIEEYCRLTVIESGHQVLHHKHAKDILAALKDKY